MTLVAPAPRFITAGAVAPVKSVQHQAGFWALALGSVGVVYGDIGTRPLYAFQAALQPALAGGVGRGDILGVVSLALWALILVVTVKYVLFLMRADNNGEGGVLSLMALVQRAMTRQTALVFGLGLVGAALFYGDAMITPAISVLSAVDGLRSIPSLKAHIGPDAIIVISVVILLGLFLVQSRGTEKVGKFFGPIMVVWFAVIAGLGVLHIVSEPAVFAAFSPLEAGSFLARHGIVGFSVLGAVFLTVTGAEALYADMGHFRRWPIQASWLYFVLPALMLNYLGQGAFALKALAVAQAAHRPLQDTAWFFEMAPEALRPLLVVLATAATVIASQAVITGAFSLTQQALQLGLLPRMTVRRTSETQSGQIYLPQINWLLLVGVLFLVAVFKSWSNLSEAYGLAVTGTMVVTTTLAFLNERHGWKWSLLLAVGFTAPLFGIDLVFLAANAMKIPSGGWLPLTIGAALMLVMLTWMRGTALLRTRAKTESLPLAEVIAMVGARPPFRAPGTAIFLTSDPCLAPVALMHNLKHNKVLHEKNIILTVRTAETPRVSKPERLYLERLDENFSRATLTFGFMETPNLPRALGMLKEMGLKYDPMTTSFFLGRRTVVARPGRRGMPLWQDKLFVFLTRNAENPTDFFHIPPGRVVEMGTQISV